MQALPIRLIAMDMDGTLLGRENRDAIPAENVAALQEAHARGIELALCSGRMPDDVSCYALSTGLPMHILGLNGGSCLDEPLGRIVSEGLFTPEATRRMMALLDGMAVTWSLFAGNEVITDSHAEDYPEGEQRWGTFITQGATRCIVRYGGEGTEAMIQRGVAKLVIIDDHATGALPRLRTLLQEQVPEAEVSSSWHNNIEINPVGVNKGTAVAALAARLGIPLAQVMAIGDNDNDLPMLTCAGYGVAMANGTAAVQAAARYRTLDNDDNGVAAAIRTLALGQPVNGVVRLR